MLVVKFVKVNQARYLSHLDILRHITRTIKRAGIEVEYSQGFNEHMLLNLSAPLPLGLESVAEYFHIVTPISSIEFVERFNRVNIDGLYCVNAYEVAKNPNIMGNSYSSDYDIYIEGLKKYEEQILNIVNLDEFNIKYFHNGAEVCSEQRSNILSLKFEKDVLNANLRSGNVNLRADRFAYNLARIFDLIPSGIKLCKTKQFLSINGIVVDCDKHLADLKLK